MIFLSYQNELKISELKILPVESVDMGIGKLLTIMS